MNPYIKTIPVLLLCAGIFTACHGASQNTPGEAAKKDVTGISSIADSMALENVEYETDNAFSCSFDAVPHKVILDLPETKEGAPVIFMLHGYGQTGESFRDMVHLEETACPRGYAVVYVTGAKSGEDKTSSNGWNAGIGMNQNRDVDFLVALAHYLEETYSFDPSRTYAVGFSNGAFMTHRLANEASNTFEAVVSVAGMMPRAVWKERAKMNSVGVFQMTGEKDDVVPKNSDDSAKTNPNPAIEEVMDYYIQVNDAKFAGEEKLGDSVLTKYAADSGRQVWNLFLAGGYHSWPAYDVRGIDANELILEFLDANR